MDRWDDGDNCGYCVTSGGGEGGCRLDVGHPLLPNRKRLSGDDGSIRRVAESHFTKPFAQIIFCRSSSGIHSTILLTASIIIAIGPD